jgi:hypothetical protein
MMQLAKMVGDMATVEPRTADPDPLPKTDASAVKRGEARAESLTPKRRNAIAKKAAKARWKGSR